MKILLGMCLEELWKALSEEHGGTLEDLEVV